MRLLDPRRIYYRLVKPRDREVLWNLRRSLNLPWHVAALHQLRWQTSTPEEIASRSLQALGPGSHSWCFILGVNNSGTTLLERILHAHPEVRGLPHEGQFLTSALPQPPELGVSRLWTMNLERFRWTEADEGRPALRCIYDWTPYFARETGHVLLEKSPPNTVRSRWLQRHFSRARFIAMVRSPYAVAEGIRRRTQASIEAAAEHWSRANRILLDDLSRLDRATRLKYEDFCESPAVHLERLRAFLQLDAAFPEEATKELEVHNIEGTIGGIRDFNEKSMRRLSAHDIRTIERIAGPLMEDLGYERLG